MPSRKPKGGLTKWFKEDWRDVKTGKKCGRSGKKDKGRPYPACRPKSKASSASAKRAAKRKTGPARISWKTKSKRGKKECHTLNIAQSKKSLLLLPHRAKR